MINLAKPFIENDELQAVTDVLNGENVIVGALSLIRQNVPDRHIMGGNPLRFIGDVIIDGKENKKDNTVS